MFLLLSNYGILLKMVNEEFVDVRSAAIILIKDGKALLQLRDDNPKITYPNHWGFAGGGSLDEGETYIQAAQRELKEEVGYVSKNPTLFMTKTYQLPDGRTVKTKRYFEDYDGVQELTCNEGQKIEFLSPDEIDNLKMYPGVGEAAKEAVELSAKSDTIIARGVEKSEREFAAGKDKKLQSLKDLG